MAVMNQSCNCVVAAVFTGDNPEKIWAHPFFAAGGMGGAVNPPGGPG